MAPRINLTTLKAMEATVATRAMERKKKRLAIDAGQYELRRPKKRSRVKVETAQVEVETAPAILPKYLDRDDLGRGPREKLSGD